MDGEDFIQTLLPPVEQYLTVVETFLAGLEKPSLKLFMTSLLDQEKEHLKDIAANFLSREFPEKNDPEYLDTCKKLLETMIRNLPQMTDSLSLIKDTIERKKAAYELFSYLASSIAISSVSDSFTSIAMEEKRHIKLLEDRLTLEELSSGLV